MDETPTALFNKNDYCRIHKNNLLDSTLETLLQAIPPSYIIASTLYD